MTRWLDRYLSLLGVDATSPSLAALSEITAAHPQRVPFENISSILRRRACGTAPVPPLDLDLVLDAWCDRSGGGVCFEVMAMVDRMLTELGYRTHPVLGQISFPGSHGANLVELSGRRYLVDLGNGAPFVEPIPLDGEVEVRHAGLAYRFRPDCQSDCWFQDRWIDAAWEPFCRYLLTEPDPVVRETAYQQHHTIGQSWVVDSLVLLVSSADEVWSLRGRELRHFTADGKTVEQLADNTNYATLAASIFDLPKLPIDAAREALSAR
jgi:arylamine N-acetyltransferase